MDGILYNMDGLQSRDLNKVILSVGVTENIYLCCNIH